MLDEPSVTFIERLAELETGTSGWRGRNMHDSMDCPYVGRFEHTLGMTSTPYRGTRP